MIHWQLNKGGDGDVYDRGMLPACGAPASSPVTRDPFEVTCKRCQPWVGGGKSTPMSANDAPNRNQFGIELGQYDSEASSEDEDLHRFLTVIHKELEETVLPTLHSKIRSAAITVGADDADVIYGLIRHAHRLLEQSDTVPGRLSQSRMVFLLDGLEAARAAFEMADQRTCRECGCSDWDACLNGCWWVAEDLCSNCAPAQLRRGMEQ